MRRWWQELLRLQELRVRSVDVSGYEGLEAVRRLRWSGDRLVGDRLGSEQATRLTHG